MSRSADALHATALLALLLSPCIVDAVAYDGIGRAATSAEIRAWNIDVRPDFEGLPPGSGSVAKGQEIFDGRCASCHGTFGESNDVFTPLIGGTTKDDIQSGRTKTLATGGFPHRTIMMKLSTLSSMWDYIHRAMPWNAPKSLSADDVYAVTAYLLNLADVMPDDGVLSDKNIRQFQERLPNRNGMTLDHGMWDVHGKPDVKSVACMQNCVSSVVVSSSLPPESLGSNGNPRDQNRLFGEVVGTNSNATVVAEAASSAPPISAMSTPASPGVPPDIERRLTADNCVACHRPTQKLVGPALSDISRKYAHDPGAMALLKAKLKNGGSGVWGSIPMPAQPQLNDDDVTAILSWILGPP